MISPTLEQERQLTEQKLTKEFSKERQLIKQKLTREFNKERKLTEQELTKKFKNEVVEEEFSKVLAANAYRYNATTLIPGGTKKKDYPWGIDSNTLRDFSIFYPIARACINFRKSQISQLDWDIAPIELDKKGENNKDKNSKTVKEIKSFLRYPLGDKVTSFRVFQNTILEDLMVLDAIAVYRKRSKGDKVLGYLPVDPTTIEIKINKDGSIPVPPAAAYVQKIRNEIIAELTSDDLIYGYMNARSNTPYGLSALESLIITVTTALKLNSYNLGYLTEGNVPEGFVELPPEVASSREQFAQWQMAWDAMLEGDPRYQRKIKFMPLGMKFTPTKKPEDMAFERFEKWLMLNTTMVFGVSPSDIGITEDVNKAVAQTQWEVGKERGMQPVAFFLKEIYDRIIQYDMGYEDYHFVWTNLNPTNKKDESDVMDTLTRLGAVSIDEWRIGEGLEPIGLSNYIMTPVGPVLVKDILKQSEAGNVPAIPYKPAETPPNPEVAPVAEGGAKKMDTEQAVQLQQAEIVEELKKWKKMARNCIKQGKTIREFHTTIVDKRTQRIISDGLKEAITEEDIDDLFNPFIDSQGKLRAAMLDMYEQLTGVIATKTPASQ